VVRGQASACTVLLCLIACGGAASPEADGDVDEGPALADAVIEGAFRGMAIFDVDRRPRFEPCGPNASPALALVDSTGGELPAAYQELVGEPGGRLYVELRGRVEPSVRGVLDSRPSRLLVAQEVRRAAFDTEGCDESLQGVAFHAHGNEPFWSVEVTTIDITLERPGAQPLRFPYAASVDSAGLRVYSTSLPSGTKLRLAIHETRCQDGMSGFWFPFAAELRLDGETMSGCAAEGW
jgi:putative lipoprotein